MSFPSSIPSYQGFTSTHTLQADNHAAQHTQEQADIVALATKVGTGASTPTSGTVLAGNGTGTSTWRALTGADVGFNQLTVLQAVYPVGCIYAETTGVNPNTTFGFGTWSQTGQGRVLVGQGTSDQLFSAGVTGGESNHTLTGAESGTSTHSHAVTDPGHSHTGVVGNAASGSIANTGATTTPTGNTGIGSNTTGLTVNNSTAANASSSHNNLQPYQVIYYWTRTA